MARGESIVICNADRSACIPQQPFDNVRVSVFSSHVKESVIATAVLMFLSRLRYQLCRCHSMMFANELSHQALNLTKIATSGSLKELLMAPLAFVHDAFALCGINVEQKGQSSKKSPRTARCHSVCE